MLHQILINQIIVDSQKLIQFVDKYTQNFEKKANIRKIKQLIQLIKQGAFERIAIKIIGGGTEYVQAKDILYLKADENTTMMWLLQ